MFGLAAKVIEILATASVRLLDRRVVARDASVARLLLGIVVLLQDLCLRGDQLLVLARRFADGAGDETTEAQFDRLLRQQVQTVSELRDALVDARPVLTTVDADVYLQLAPFLDAKSGLLTRWEQQRRASTFSTTTLFFLPSGAVDGIAAHGRSGATTDGLADDRGDFVMAMADTIRETRAAEVRDIRHLNDAQSTRLRADIDGAQADLRRASPLCGQLQTAIEEAVGPAAMASLRRDLLKDA